MQKDNLKKHPPKTTRERLPAVCGVLRPMLLLNESFFQMLSREEADFVLRHELMHIRRGDILLNTMLFGLLSLHWFNPLLWYAFFRAGADREAACDEDVLHAESPARRVAYGKTLLRMETELPQPGLCLGFVGMVQKGKRIRERIQFISNPKRMRLPVKSLALLCMCVTAILGIAQSAEPPSKPQTQQASLAKEEPETEEARSEKQQREISLKFRKVGSLKFPGEDLSLARVSVSFEQNSVLARVPTGEQDSGLNSRVRFSRYDVVLQDLNAKSPRRTSLGDHYFGFVPKSNLAFEVRWGTGVRFWNTRTHAPSGDYMSHELREDTTILPAVSPDGKVMVTRSQLDHLQFWNIETRQPITKEIKQPGVVSSMRFSADGKWFFSRSRGRLSIRDPRTGDLVVANIRHDASGYAYLSASKQLLTVQNDHDDESGWHSELVIRGGKAFAERRRIEMDGQTQKAAWIDKSHILVVGRNPDLRSNERETLYVVTLSDNKTDVRTLLHYNWIREAVVAPDRTHFVVRTLEETSCWKVGGREPVWTRTGDHLVSFGDRDWVLFHKGPAFAYSLADGSELWRGEDVRLCKVFGSKIWTCNDEEMETWQVEPDTAPLKSAPSAERSTERKSNKDEKTPHANTTKAEIISISTVGPRTKLQTDTDIVRYKGHFYIAFAKPTRERQNAIHILQSVDGRDWKVAATLRSEIEERRPDVTHSTHYSGRPVWFSTMPSGRLCVTGRASEKTIVWSTDDGADWREELEIKLSRSYSRIHWQHDRAYCVSDETSSCGEKFELFRLESAGEGSAPKTVYELSHNSHTRTGPRESQLAFAADQAFCMLSFKTYNFDKVRRWLIPSGTYATGRIGVSKAPYTEWTWTPTNLKFGHPNLLVLKDARIVSSVFIDGDEAHSALCQIDPSTNKLTELLRFPTGGIRQPVGMAEHDGHIWASFYNGPPEGEKPVLLKVAKIKLVNPPQMAFSQQPISKGAWTFKSEKPESVTFDYGTELTAREVDRLSNCTSLTRFVMGYAGVDSEYVTIEGDLLKLGRLKNLEEVHLCKDGIDDDDLKFIALLPKIHTLEFNADNGYDGAPICTDRCADHLSSVKTLRSLVIHDGRFTDKFVEKITEGLSNLEVLSLKSAELTDESLRLLSERCKKLKSLSIISAHFTAEGLKHLDKLKDLEKRAVSSPALRDRSDPKEVLRFPGTWEYVSATYEGKPSKLGNNETITLTEDDWTLRRNGELISRSTWEIDSTRSPKWLTQCTEGGKVNFLDRWVYKFDEERLVLCKSSRMDERRPKEFKSQEGDGQYLIVLRRIDTTGKNE